MSRSIQFASHHRLRNNQRILLHNHLHPLLLLVPIQILILRFLPLGSFPLLLLLHLPSLIFFSLSASSSLLLSLSAWPHLSAEL